MRAKLSCSMQRFARGRSSCGSAQWLCAAVVVRQSHILRARMSPRSATDVRGCRRIVAQMLLFGLLWGLAWGWMLSRMLRSVYNDRLVEISLTIGASYLCFWTAEMFLSSSAVIGVVVMGFYLNHNRATAVSPEVLHTMHEFFEIIAWMFNTVIFFIAGYKARPRALTLAHAMRTCTPPSHQMYRAAAVAHSRRVAL